jgi:hypothetical protein
MRYSLAILSLFIAACVSRTSPKAVDKSTATRDWAQELDVLEQKELRNPSDPSIKWRLSILHVCQGNLGLAFEKWLWIEQFAPSSSYAAFAKQRLEDSAVKLDPVKTCQDLEGRKFQAP